MSASELAKEPFRLFFPAAVLAGLLGAAVWPLHFGGVLELYPGLSHGRLMAHGFFGGFIFGFLGTALPRMLSSPPFTITESILYVLLHVSMTLAHAVGRTAIGDLLFVLILIGYTVSCGARFLIRKDMPPPGFLLIPIAFVCAWTGALIPWLERDHELPLFWLTLRPLVSYQGFILLPILGVGGFILPRFFGLPSRQEFEESRTAPAGWWTQALMTLVAGLALLLSFVIEAWGWHRFGPLLRLAICAGWFVHQIPFYKRGAGPKTTLARILQFAFLLLLLGIVSMSVAPGFRVGLLHLTLVGGFGILTLAVATRVAFGHSGNQSRLESSNRWFIWAAALMLLGMATRISGDFLPEILVSHYNYGAGLWFIGLLLWAWNILPLMLVPDPE